MQRNGFLILSLMALSILMTSCAYRMGSVGRGLPGGLRLVSVPIFKNKSMEPGIEMSFTNALLQEFTRSKVAKVVEPASSDLRVEGVITNIQYLPGGKKTSDDPSFPFLSEGAVLAAEYRILVSVTVNAIRVADGTVAWTGTFSGERTYAAPQVTLAGVNSVNPLYNLSARRQNIEVVANDVAAEIYDRITENF